MNVVDSSGWLEYFGDDSNAQFFAPAIEAVDDLLVPTISILEVFKRVTQQRGHDDALQAVAAMQQGTVVVLDPPVALLAAQLGLEHGLPLADSVILATARRFGATLWTQDSDFKGLPQVRYKSKRRR